MDTTIIFPVIFTFIIHLVGTLGYSVRISGTRTGTIALSFALFNIILLQQQSGVSGCFQLYMPPTSILMSG